MYLSLIRERYTDGKGVMTQKAETSQTQRVDPAPAMLQYSPPTILWEQEFVALASYSATDPCFGQPPSDMCP